MTELVDKLIAYAAGQVDDDEAERIEALLIQYEDQNLDPDLANQIEQAIDKDRAFAEVIAEARTGKHWFEETLSSELRPRLDAPASLELQRFVETLTTDQTLDDNIVRDFPQHARIWVSEHRWLAVAASLAIVMLASGWALYGVAASRLDDARIAQARLEREIEQSKTDRELETSRIIVLEDELRRQAIDLDHSVAARDTAQQQVARASIALETLRSNREELNTSLLELRAELGKATEHERKNASNRAILKEAQAQLKQEQTLAATRQDTIDALEEKLANSVLIIEAMNTENSGLNKQIAELEQSMQTQAAAFEKHQSQLVGMQQRSTELQAELDDAIQQVIRLRADRRVLQTTLQQSEPEFGADWTIQVAEYHGLYARQAPRHLVEVPAEQSAHIEEWLSDQLGRTMAIPDLSDSGLEFKGARLLAIGGMPVAQLMYLDDSGEPLAICVMRNIMGNARDAERSEHNDLKLVDWRDRAYQYVVVGSTSFETLEVLADKLTES